MKKLALIIGMGAALAGAVYLAFGGTTAEVGRIMLQPTDGQTVALGQDVYATNCASCHGADLEGAPNWRSPDADGRMPAPPHDANGHTWHHDGDTLFRLTKYGVAAYIGDPDYASNMPIYDGLLLDAEIIAVISYIKSTWPQEIRDRHDEMENTQ
ncbi:putative cytochrome c-like protein [Octadecabacter antarcticus 307]|uniref:Putative cytochrome c-like protein n=1 Tax=Octadecabacter antarcticus 307 TaxID=391626 RepID=M9R969_9RHOB|nr:c-type cytochrome [Octadecabacter antarcticus]AGI69204.1 putative cytochrome c-like protein [Octadecabacter antarcticus 307]